MLFQSACLQRLLGVCLLLSLGSAAWAMKFEFRPLTAQRTERLSKPARQEYELALGAVDKVNFDLAIDHLNRATQAEPDNPWLRFCATQVAIYLGDTRHGAESIKYYDLAAQNLQSIASSPKLNVREQQRAQGWLETVTQLRQSVLERDNKRIQYGREIAKQYAKEIYRSEEAEKEKAEKEGRKMTEKKPGTAGAETLGEDTLAPGETRDIKHSVSEPQSGPAPMGSNPDTARKQATSNTGETKDLEDR